MKEMTLERAQEQLRLATEAFKAVGGKLPDTPVSQSNEVSCAGLYGAAATLMWFAAEDRLQGGDYWQWYSAAAQMHVAAAKAQGC